MFDASVYAARRRRLASSVSSGLIVLLGNGESPINAVDNPYPFRQDSSMLYYTGADAPGFDAVIDADAGSATLYGEDPTLDDVVWMGPQTSIAERAERAGLDATGSPADLAERLAEAVRQGRPVHFLPPYRDTHRQRLQDLVGICADRADDYASGELADAVVRQRSIKSEAEIRQIERAVASTAAIHEYAMSTARPGRVEREIAGLLAGLARSRGGELSFQPICSVRGEVLHNHSYDNTMNDGDLLLVDAGATSAMHYAGDVTRVTPVGGTFTERQKTVYQVVLDAQESAIAACEPGVPFRDVHLHAARVMAEGLTDLGLMKGDPEAAVEAGAHALFFPHGLGHMMGLDVHDMEALGEDRVGYADHQERSDQFGLSALRLARPLEPGFVLTVEPGCYFIPELIRRWKENDRHAKFIDYDAVDDFVGFGGIRIEDDVLITESGHRVLGPRIPKSVDEVEEMAQ